MQNDWITGEDSKKGIQRVEEKAVLVGLVSQGQTEAKVQEYLDELEFH